MRGAAEDRAGQQPPGKKSTTGACRVGRGKGHCKGGVSRRAALRQRGGGLLAILGEYCLNSRSNEKPLARLKPEAVGIKSTF